MRVIKAVYWQPGECCCANECCARGGMKERVGFACVISSCDRHYVQDVKGTGHGQGQSQSALCYAERIAQAPVCVSWTRYVFNT